MLKKYVEQLLKDLSVSTAEEQRLREFLHTLRTDSDLLCQFLEEPPDDLLWTEDPDKKLEDTIDINTIFKNLKCYFVIKMDI